MHIHHAFESCETNPTKNNNNNNHNNNERKHYIIPVCTLSLSLPLACAGQNKPAPSSIKCVTAGFPSISFSYPGVSVSGG